MLIVSASEMAALDRATIEDIGIPGIVLMENAARGAADFYMEILPDILERRICVVAGSGNNAGDGFVLARIFSEKGSRVHVICLRDPSRLKGDALINFRILEKLNVAIQIWDETGEFEPQISALKESGVIIDAILGTGLKDEVRGLYRRIIEVINELPIPVLAVDIPSGLDASRGIPLGVAVRAFATATFGLPKIGQYIPPGEQYVGHLRVIDIGIPRSVVEQSGINRWLLDESQVAGMLSPRPSEIHKGHGGHVVVLAGSPGKTGAATLVCLGAGRVGSGLVTLCIPASLNPIMEVKLTEAMTLPIQETKNSCAALESVDTVLEFLKDKQVLAMGPGSSLEPETQSLMRALIERVSCPMVLDADALTALSADVGLLKRTRAPVVITPHPGEMSRLTGLSTKEIQSRRLQVAADFSKTYGCVVVLKGHRTVVAAPDGRLAINDSGNPAMATGGVGDVLTGMIAGLLAQGIDTFYAACIGVYVHGAAADLCYSKKTTRGLLASDLLKVVPEVIGRLEEISCKR